MAKCLVCYRDDLPNGKYYHQECSQKIFGTKEPPELNYNLADMKELARKIVRSQGVMTGVQPKISLGLEKTEKERSRLTLMMGEFILKPPSQYYPQMPETEDLTMHLAEHCKITTVPHALIPLASGELAYITRRIDRSGGEKIHMEDFCQLSELLTEDKYRSSMERVGKLVGQLSSFPGLNLFNLFELTLFNFITGNNDMHLKNFSLIDRRGDWQLSPAYDLLNVNLVNEQDNEESALTIAGKKRKLKRQDFIQLGTSYDLNETQIRNAFGNILDREKELSDFIEKSFLTDAFKDQYRAILKNRCQVLSKNS
jgi:serine/threonine-protein kinase HipA